MKALLKSELNQIKVKRAERNYVDTLTLEKRIKERVYTIKDLGANYRWLDHWHSKGLLLSSYDKHRWKKFNLIEYVWVKITIKIKEFNMGLNTVARVKEALDFNFKGNDILKNPESNFSDVISQLAPPGKSQIVKEIIKNPEIKKNIKETRFNMLEIIIMDILQFGNCYSIFINPGGDIIPVKYSYIELFSDIPEFKSLIYGSFVSISITEILRDFIIDKELNIKNRLALLTEEEVKVLKSIRQDDLKSVIIRFDKNKKINLLEEVKESKVDKAKRLAELIMSKGYQDITLKIQNGDIVYCENKKKTLIQNKE